MRNSVPAAAAPPDEVVPYRFPSDPNTSAERGAAPSGPMKECSVVNVNPPKPSRVMKYTEPLAKAPPFSDVPYKSPFGAFTTGP